MAVRIVCDGCGEDIQEGKSHELGIVRKGEYCDLCSNDVLRFVAARNELHTAIAEEWMHRLDALRDGFYKTHPNGRLPDE